MRPPSVTIIGWLFILAGTVGFLYHLTELKIPITNDAIWVLVVRLLAIVGGILVLKGANAGRWLLITWMAYHVILSFFHSASALAMHTFLLVAIAVILFSARATRYFGRPSA